MLCASRSGSLLKGRRIVLSRLTMASALTSKTCSRVKVYHGKTAASTLIRSKVCQNSQCSQIAYSSNAFRTGNEADHVIISVVRTEKIGFLNNRRRSNVMLSRCKRSMTICTNRAFVNGEALTTLLGDMCAEWGSGAWLSTRDILAGRF